VTDGSRTEGNVPLGPVFGLVLVGVLLLSGLLYYRAVNVQRFLEPALALSLPRSELSQHLGDAIEREFKGYAVKDIRLRSSSIVIEKALLFSSSGVLRSNAPVVLKKLARVYLTALDENTRPNVSLILVISRYPVRNGVTDAARKRQRRQAEMTLDALFRSEPELAAQFGRFFASTAVPASLVQDPDTIEFQIIPSELMHAGVLQKLVKYVH